MMNAVRIIRVCMPAIFIYIIFTHFIYSFLKVKSQECGAEQTNDELQRKNMRRMYNIYTIKN